MKKISLPPQDLVDAATRGSYIDPKHPYVKKMMKEEREKEKKLKEEAKKRELARALYMAEMGSDGKTNQQFFDEVEEKIKGLSIEKGCLLRMSLYGKRNALEQTKVGDRIWKGEYEVVKPCTTGGCKCQKAKKVYTPNEVHYGKLECDVCYKFIKWIPYPKSFDEIDDGGE
tara:strand:- start:46 stop:558 length:513 start_codon:yes stop_codon:yes gene_type:complete